jgi:hypothetical protein
MHNGCYLSGRQGVYFWVAIGVAPRNSLRRTLLCVLTVAAIRHGLLMKKMFVETMAWSRRSTQPLKFQALPDEFQPTDFPVKGVGDAVPIVQISLVVVRSLWGRAQMPGKHNQHKKETYDNARSCADASPTLPRELPFWRRGRHSNTAFRTPCRRN